MDILHTVFPQLPTWGTISFDLKIEVIYTHIVLQYSINWECSTIFYLVFLTTQQYKLIWNWESLERDKLGYVSVQGHLH